MMIEHSQATNGLSSTSTDPDRKIVNGINDPKPLEVVIVGAGIGGLAAAIGLRRAGHNVSV